MKPLVPILGDMVIARNFNYENPALVIEVVDSTNTLHALGCIDERQDRYSMPGTLAVSDVIRIVGHKPLEEVVEAYSRSLAFGTEPSAELRSKVRENLAKQISRLRKG